MLYTINHLSVRHSVKRIILGMLILFLFPISQGFSQEYYDNTPTLSVSLTNESPFVYQDSEGYTVVVGIVENNNSLTAVTNARVQASFYDDTSFSPLAVNEGRTVLEVIPPNGISPYVIRSPTPDPTITQVSVSFLGFDASEEKQKGLVLSLNDISLDTSLTLSGILENAGAPNNTTNVYLAFYDGFEPPRTLGVSTIELGEVPANAKIPFQMDTSIDARAVGFQLFAESDIFSSDFMDVKIPMPQSLSKLVTITNVSVKDPSGNALSEIPVGSTVNIESQTIVELGSAHNDKIETPFTYFVQIKESGTTPFVEFLGKYDGRFVGDGIQHQTIDWIPEKKGLFFVETFVWDKNNVPIAEQGPFVLIIVN